jgi:hypothetical protein
MSMEIWDKLKTPPSTALKQIQAGRLRGKSDINPQWRYQAMTEAFGMCGIGWKYTVDEVSYKEGDNGQIVCFVMVSLYVKQEGEWSAAIPANGGSMFIANEKNGPFTSDEAVKMATTDALGTAMKMLGLAANVYLGNMEGSKYSAPVPQPSAPAQQPQPSVQHKALPALTPDDADKWAKAIAALSTGSTTIDKIRKAYTLTDHHEAMLNLAKDLQE